MARAKGISLNITADVEVRCVIQSDPVRLRQILLNIIGNAIKFTAQGSVDVSVRFQHGPDGASTLEFLVKDTGCGISADAAAKLFAAFTQADESTTRKFGGTGLGLVLSRRLAQVLGGDVSLCESTPGAGSIFKITIDPGEVRVDLAQTAGGAPLKFASEKVFQERGKLHGLKFLLVDDGPDNQFLVGSFLRIAGAEVDVADNGREGMEKALSTDYDAVLMDIQMPIMDGYTSTEALRKKGYRKPILALTARAMTGERDRCLAGGFDDHVSKPIERDELIGKLLRRTHHENHP